VLPISEVRLCSAEVGTPTHGRDKVFAISVRPLRSIDAAMQNTALVNRGAASVASRTTVLTQSESSTRDEGLTTCAVAGLKLRACTTPAFDIRPPRNSTKSPAKGYDVHGLVQAQAESCGTRSLYLTAASPHRYVLQAAWLYRTVESQSYKTTETIAPQGAVARISYSGMWITSEPGSVTCRLLSAVATLQSFAFRRPISASPTRHGSRLYDPPIDHTGS
jgi:hypothetical protein